MVLLCGWIFVCPSVETATTRLAEADDPITAGPSGSYPDEALWNYCIAYRN